MARDFGGTSNDHIDYGAVLALPITPCLFFGWIKIHASGRNAQTIVGHGTSGPNVGWDLRAEQFNNTGNLGFTKSGRVDFNSAISFSQDNWIFVAVEYESGNTLKLWRVEVDGTITTATNSNSVAIATGSDVLMLGARGTGITNFLDANGAFFGVFESISGGFTDDEIKSIAFNPTSIFGYGKPDVFVPLYGNESPEMNWGDQGGTGTINGSVPKVDDSPPIEALENFV